MNKILSIKILRIVSVCCAILLFIAVLPNPLKYYWVLRVIVSLGAILVIIKNITNVFWVVLFGVILVLFNPVFSIHFYMKLPWIPIDIITGLLFLVEIILTRPKKAKVITPKQKETKTYERDRII